MRISQLRSSGINVIAKSARIRKSDPPAFMTLEELVEYAQISKQMIYRLLRQGKITARRVDSDFHFSRADVDRALHGPSNAGARLTTIGSRRGQ